MSKVFKRPMFRKGGNVNEGIMTGIVDREMHALSNPDGVGFSNRTSELAKRNLDILMQNIDQDKGIDPITQFLVEFGPELARQKPGAGLINAIVSATGKPIKSLLETKGKERQFLRNLKSGATQLAIEQAGKEDILSQEIAGRMQLKGMEGVDNIDRVIFENQLKEELGVYVGRPQVATRAAEFKSKFADDLRGEVGGEKYGGVLTFDISNPSEVKANLKTLKQLEGKFVYDPFSNNYKKITFENGRPGVGGEYSDIKSIRTTSAGTTPGEAPLNLTDYQKDVLRKADEARKIKEEEEKKREIQRKKQFFEKSPTLDISGA